jgi:hypothetical protein
MFRTQDKPDEAKWGIRNWSISPFLFFQFYSYLVVPLSFGLFWLYCGVVLVPA